MQPQDRKGQEQIEAVMHVVRVLASTANYEQTLADLIRTISELLNVETGGFLVYDKERDELILQQPAFGIQSSSIISEYHVSPYSGGNAAAVFLSRQPYMTNSADKDPRLIYRFVEMFAARNVLSVPLVVDNNCIGVFHAINKRGDFDHWDLELLSLVAPILAMSIQSAQMFREMSEARHQLERAMFIQNELSRTAFNAPGIEPLARRLCEILGRPIMVVDTAMIPVARIRWPTDLEPEPGWFDKTSGRGRAAGEIFPTLTPIEVGQNIGGHVAVLEDGRPLDLIDQRAIEQATTVLALEMLRERSTFEAESKAKGGLLRDLLSGVWTDENEAVALLGRIGYTINQPCRAARLHATFTHDAETETIPEKEPIQGNESRIYATFTQICRDIYGVSAISPWRSGYFAVLPSVRDEGSQDARMAEELLERLVAACRLMRPPFRLHLALGSQASSVRDLARSAEEADRALIVARRLPIAERPVFFEHLGVYRLLVGPNDPVYQGKFVEEVLGPLLQYDTEHGSELLSTLRCWTSMDHHVGNTAKRLYLHPNTVKYRLRQIRNLLGGDLGHGDMRLQVELALKILDLPRLDMIPQQPERGDAIAT